LVAAPVLELREMTFRSTLILLVSAACLFAFIYFFESRLPEDSTKRSAARIISGLDSRSIGAVEITRSNNLVVRIQRTNENWQLTNPPYPRKAPELNL